MGHTLAEWRARVADLIRDEAGVDVSFPAIETAMRSALVEHAKFSSFESVDEAAGEGSPYFDLPDGWIDGFSDITGVEHPARQNPPVDLCHRSWRVVRSPTDVTVKQILLDRSPSSSEWVRFTFTAYWPFPTTDAGDDRIPDGDFEAVANLVAAYCCEQLQSSAARSRIPAMNSETVPSGDRAASLKDAATSFRESYKRLVGFSSFSVA